MTTSALDHTTCNGSLFCPNDPAGHYESYFQRANRHNLPPAFWIHNTVFSPQGRPSNAVGELWVIYFDSEANALLQSHPDANVALQQAVHSIRCVMKRMVDLQGPLFYLTSRAQTPILSFYISGLSLVPDLDIERLASQLLQVGCSRVPAKDISIQLVLPEQNGQATFDRQYEILKDLVEKHGG
jgi:methylase of polypeptide subunit release factors